MRQKRWLLALAAVVTAWGMSACGGGSSGIVSGTDQTAPVIDGVRASRSTNNVVIVEAQVYDDTAVQEVEALAVDGSLLTRQYRMSNEYGNRYRSALPQSVLRVTVRAKDSAGNTATSSEVLVPPPNPPDFE
jgi:hypothetical protein